MGIRNMKKLYFILKSKNLALLTFLMLSGYLFATPVSDCTITKDNGPCFKTTLTSVTLNDNNTYTIVLTVTNNGDPGPICQELSHYSVEGIPDTYSNVIVNVVSGTMNYDHDIAMGPNLGNSTPFFGFKIDNTTGIGDGHPGVFTVTYTLTQLQDQKTSAKAGNDFQIATFTLADFQSVLSCGQPKVANPTMSIDCKTVTLACSISNATIRYTIGNTLPTATTGTVYSSPITISSSSTINAIAISPGMTNSEVVSGSYTIQQVATPTFLPLPNTYSASQNVYISSSPGATIYYTLNGDAPTTSSTKYISGPVVISANKTLRAIAVNDCMVNSNEASGNYVINEEETHNPFPSTGFASIAFEDLWPAMGDYDMNDIVVDCKFDQISNSQNKVIKVEAQFILRAMGANFHNGFGLQLPVTPDKVSSCVLKLNNGQSVPMAGLVSINSNGLEQGQAKAVVIIFDDGFKVLPQIYSGIGVNTTTGIPWTDTQTINMTLTFSEPIDPNLLVAPYNPFIFANKLRGAEIHLPNNAPTSLADMSLFKTNDDDSNVSTFGTSSIRSYITSKNLPWAILFYKKYDYPIEKTAILDAFKHFSDWAQSGGELYPDWYFNTTSGYRDASKVYIHQ